MFCSTVNTPIQDNHSLTIKAISLDVKIRHSGL